MEIGNMIERISSININLLIDESIEQTKSQLIMLIRSQILHGERKDGSSIGTYSSFSYDIGYIDTKHDLGLFPINTEPYYNLNWTGDFLDKIEVTIKKEFIEIQSGSKQESYVEINVDNLDNVYELSPDRLGEYAHVHFYPIFMQKIRQKLDL